MRGHVAKALRRQALLLAEQHGQARRGYQDVPVRRRAGRLRKLQLQRQRQVNHLSGSLGPEIAERVVPPVSRTATVRRCVGTRAGYLVLKDIYKRRRSTP